jgi:hypothetical protein
MTVANTTQAFRDQIGSNSTSSGSTNSPLLTAVLQANTPGDMIQLASSQCYLLVDTRRFSQYSITELEMEHVYGTGDRVNPTVPVNATEIKIRDSTGMSFFNLLMDLFRNKLQSTRASAFFLLAIEFVGHKDDGTTQTVSTCFIPMIMLTMGWQFSGSGSEYQLSMMETEGAPSRGSAFENINLLGNIRSITTQANTTQQAYANTISGMCNALEYQLNLQSLTFFNKYYNNANSVVNAPASSVNNSPFNFGKLVQYMISVPDEWKNYKITLAAKSKNKEQIFITNLQAGVDTDPAPIYSTILNSQTAYSQMSFSACSTTITDAIKSILEASLDILNLASEANRKAGTAVAYKISTNITSDENTYLVHFDVIPYQLPLVSTKPNNNSDTLIAGSSNLIGSSKRIKNLITYNYLFTGYNSHIIDLKIDYIPESAVALDTNLTLGQNTLNNRSALMSNSVSSSAQSANSGADKKTVNYSPDLRPSDPIFYSTITVDQKNNNANQYTGDISQAAAIQAFQAKQEYSQTYAYLHFISSINLDMTIRGNPNLIKKYADRNERGGVAPHTLTLDPSTLKTLTTNQSISASTISTVNVALTTAKDQYYKTYLGPRIDASNKSTGQDDLLNGIDVTTSPVFVKLNIRSPNVDSNGNNYANSSLYTNEFFFNGPYQILTLKTMFSDGDFQQVLNLIPYLCTDSGVDSSDNTANPKGNI